MLEKDSTPAGRRVFNLSLRSLVPYHTSISPTHEGWMNVDGGGDNGTVVYHVVCEPPYGYRSRATAQPTENNELHRRSGTAGIKPTSFSPLFFYPVAVSVSFHSMHPMAMFTLSSPNANTIYIKNQQYNGHFALFSSSSSSSSFLVPSTIHKVREVVVRYGCFCNVSLKMRTQKKTL